MILTQSEDARLAKGQATIVGNTSIVEVGRRGRWLAFVRAFHTGNPAKPFDLYYESVPLGEEMNTSRGKESSHPILKLLDGYAAQVKDQDFLKRTPQRPVPAPAALGNVKLKYIGLRPAQAAMPPSSPFGKTPNTNMRLTHYRRSPTSRCCAARP